MERRPASDLLPSQHTPEAIAINQWFSDLSYYETTLEQMALSKLDDSFRDELKAIEQWFAVLSDPERTSALYALLKHTTPVQVRFFITVLTQMAAKDPLGPVRSGGVSLGVVGVGPSSLGGMKHSSVPAPVKGTDLDLLSIATGNSLRISMEGHPKTPIDAAIAQANWAAPGSISPHHPVNPVGGIPQQQQQQQPLQQQTSAAVGGMPNQIRMSPMMQPRTLSGHPGDGWGHVNLAASGRSKSGAAASSDYSDFDDYANGSTGAPGSHKEKGKIPETVDLNLINDVPSWLRSLRLHKYAAIFEGCTWKDMVKMSDADLEAKGVVAMGARNKLLKVFEMVKAECVQKGIPF
ncbi:Flap-structured DNA-binding and RNA-binding protein [Chytriomyces hyalinus]|nr:Flap-structured DNA-binding and RNA-binding protein [Chytriomyces hyalinus]